MTLKIFKIAEQKQAEKHAKMTSTVPYDVCFLRFAYEVSRLCKLVKNEENSPRICFPMKRFLDKELV